VDGVYSHTRLQSGCGYLNFISEIVGEWSHLHASNCRALQFHWRADPKSHRWNDDQRKNIAWGNAFIPTWLGYSFHHKFEWTKACPIQFYTDACDEFGFSAHDTTKALGLVQPERMSNIITIGKTDQCRQSLHFPQSGSDITKPAFKQSCIFHATAQTPIHTSGVMAAYAFSDTLTSVASAMWSRTHFIAMTWFTLMSFVHSQR